MLKYFDIARLLGAGIKCPVCSSQRCQQSKWQSSRERASAASYRPYRCADCNYRFLDTANAALERPLINGAAVVLLILGALLGFEIWLESVEQAELAAAKAKVAESTPAGNAPGDGGKTPLLPAAKALAPVAPGAVGASPAPAR